MEPETFRVGVFDSGVGGLTVVREIRRLLPSLDILYFGDTARVPYGNKSPETIIRYSLEISHFLMEQGIGHLVVACNTSSAAALDALAGSLPVPVLGMIEPGASMAVKLSRRRSIGLIGTRATVASEAYRRAVARMDPGVRFHAAACPLFVPLVEEGWAEDPISIEIARRYLGPILAKDIDTLILGCTHYPVLIPAIRAVVGEGITLVSSAQAAAAALAVMIPQEFREESRVGQLRVFVTDTGTHFQGIGETILGISIEQLEYVDEERLVFHAK